MTRHAGQEERQQYKRPELVLLQREAGSRVHERRRDDETDDRSHDADNECFQNVMHLVFARARNVCFNQDSFNVDEYFKF